MPRPRTSAGASRASAQLQRRPGNGLLQGLGLCVGLGAALAAGGPSPLAAEPAAAGGIAKIASIQNQVETKRKADAGWTPSTVHQALYASDSVRTGPASRASIFYSDRTLHRLSEKSEVEILPPSEGQPGLLKVISGTHYFSSRAPKDFGRVETATVAAAIKGTEFVVEVGADTSTKITMLEGVVEASNSFGAVTVQRGEQAYAEPGKAPVKRIVVRPRDAVAWALYYPPVLTGNDAKRLQEAGADGGDLVRAAQMLSSGEVDKAAGLIEAARRSRPQDPVALALASVVDVAANRKEDALREAEQAVAADQNSVAAALALSFAAQAAFDIPRARAMAEKAAALDPQSSLTLARVAELRLSEGDLDGATAAARQAVERAPGEARALSVLGFAELTQYRSEEAERVFEQAVSADPGLSLARMGLGIARLRRGKIAEGREELQTAASLDPDDSLLRSYLAKALYEEKLGKDASKELATAKELDPRDPTPWLYSAILEQNDNRPVEALADLRESIARNDNRAVYRSRLLLDQDRAVRGSDLARIYNDLGFEQLGLVTARKSADENQANYSSHLFLAGNYRNVPGFAPAFLSEVLQARIYQPVSVNAARPDVVNETASFNEYAALFDRPRMRAFGDAAYGRTNTNLKELFLGNDLILDQVSLDDSALRSGSLTGTANTDRMAAALSVQRIEDDGFRFNNDRALANYRGFFEYALTDRDLLQANVQAGRQDTGDLPLRLLPVAISGERIDSHLWNAALGYHHVFSARADLALSAIYNTTRQSLKRFFCDFTQPGCVPVFTNQKGSGVLTGPQLEAQQVLRFERMTWLLGAGAFRGEVRLRGTGAASLRADDEYTNLYAYTTLRQLRPFEITIGASGERVVSPTGLLVPRDAQIGVAEIELRKTRVSPKLGVSVYLPSKTTLRAAVYERLSPAIGRIQTLEPTQVAGFNQFFFEPGGTRSRTYGAGIDQEFGARLFGGAAVFRRRLDVAEAACDHANIFSGCAGRAATRIAGRESRDVDASAYLNAVITDRLTASLEYTYRKRDYDLTVVNNDGLFQDHSDTRRLRPRLRWFLPCGFFAGATATYYSQKVDRFDDLSSPERHVASDEFWIVDLSAGYKLPKRYGSIVLNAFNVGDREFALFERAVEDTFVPARVVTLGLSVTY